MGMKAVVIMMAGVMLSACTSMPDMKTAKEAAARGDYQTAYYHYNELADFGMPKAKMELGKLYLYGNGVEADPEKALGLFEEARTLGDNKNAPRFIAKAQTKLDKLSMKSKSSGSPSRNGRGLLKETGVLGSTFDSRPEEMSGQAL